MPETTALLSAQTPPVRTAEWEDFLIPLLICLLGCLFLADQTIGLPVTRSWPAVLILWGGFRLVAGIRSREVDEEDRDEAGA